MMTGEQDKSGYNNTAGRLFGLLGRARRQPDGEQSLHVWAALFEVADKNDSPSVYRYLSELNKALCEIEHDVRERQSRRQWKNLSRCCSMLDRQPN